MNSNVIAVDLAKDVLEVTIANLRNSTRTTSSVQKTISQFIHQTLTNNRFFEACGTAHHWGCKASE